MRSRRSLFTVVLLMGSLILLAACGGGSSTTTKPTGVPLIVLVTPPAPTVAIPGTVQLAANVTGSSNQGVTWSVTPSDGGAVSASGLFTPTHAGTYHVIATSAADSTRSSYAIVTVTAPAPKITSTPLTGVAIAGPYTYTPTATDPRGNSVTFALTTAPTDAKLEGGTITWTPPADGGRKPFPFTVTATTTEGGTATQSWTVYPGGTITVSKVDKYWYMAPVEDSDPVEYELTSADYQVNLSGWGISAGVPQPDGSLAWVSAVGHTDGSVTIPDVYGDKFWLNVNGDLYLTNSATYDLGEDYIGRPPQDAPAPAIKANYGGANWISTTFAFDLNGLAATDYWGTVAVTSPNAGMYAGYYEDVYPGSTIFEYTDSPRYVAPVDPTLGDSTYVYQLSTLSDNEYSRSVVLASALAFKDLATVADGTTNIAGTMGTSGTTQHVTVDNAAWSALFASSGPGNPLSTMSMEGPGGYFGMFMGTVPFVTDMFAYTPGSYGFGYLASSVKSQSAPSPSYGGGFRPVWAAGEPLAAMQGALMLGNLSSDLGYFRYVNPYPSDWKIVSGAEQWTGIPVSYPESSSPYNMMVGSQFLVEGAPTGAVAPVMSGVTNPTVNGKDFFSPSTVDKDTVTLSWAKPTGLTPYGYAVEIYYPEYDDWWGPFYTSDTSISFPATSWWFDLGSSHIFSVTALADAKADITKAPWHSKLPYAATTIVSAAVTINGVEVPAAVTAQTVRAMRKTANTNAASHPGRFSFKVQPAVKK